MMHHTRFQHWSHHQQLLGKRGISLAQVLRSIIGVYSSHPSGPLSLHARVKSFSEREFSLLEENRMVLRVPAMRQSVFLLPAETARLAVAATLPPPDDPYWQKRYSQKDRTIPRGKFTLWRAEILKCASHPLTLAEIREAVGIPDAITKTVLNRMAFEGCLLRVGAGSLRSNTLRYVATRSWAGEHRLPTGDDRCSIDKSLEWLAGEYLGAFGPARVKDFQWWAGVTSARARKATMAHDTTLIADQFLLLTEDLREFEAHRKPGRDTIDLLPPWDCYTMGYAPDGRWRFVDPDLQDRIYGSIGATGGNALGVVLLNGLAHGSWTSRFQRNQMIVSLKMFHKPSRPLRTRIAAHFDAMATVLSADGLTLDDHAA